MFSGPILHHVSGFHIGITPAAVAGVAKDTDLAEIKTAYRRLALKYHPDRIQGEDEEEKAAMKSQFQEISEAYVILSDPAKRSR